ncbi:MAG: hypothetical protein KQH63_18810 [Desulfobulbaceae bacterium]|nr:hypothetical protein [Desulfobulbaceae bacterium]
MFEFIRKGLLTGFGLVLVTRKKLMETTDKLVNEGKISRQEGEKLIEEFMDEGNRQWDDIREKINEMVHQSFDAFDIGSKKEFIELKERVVDLEKHITILEDRIASSTGDQSGVK